MQRWARTALSGVAVLGLAAGLLAVGSAAGTSPSETPLGSAASAPAKTLTASISKLQADLERVPGNFRAWSELGFAYLTKARLTADPTFYGKSEGAFAKALELRPQDNDMAVTGMAALAAARHDFAGALELADRSLTVNDFSATTNAVRTDALVELGRYDEGRQAVQRLLDLRPGGVDALTRASYSYELRGEVSAARDLLQQVVGGARVAPSDLAFAQYYLGELAWNTGDLTGAAAAYSTGITADRAYLPLVAGRAKVLAAGGEIANATADYERVVGQLPQPEFLVAYGELLEADGQLQAAQEQYAVVRATQRLFAANGQDVDTELALFEADHGSPEVAVAFAEKAFAKRPDAIFTQDAYAWALHSAGRDAEALLIARKAVRLGLKNPAFYYRLGAIEAAAGEVAAAKASLQQSLTLNPSFSPLHAPRAKALLASLP